MGRRTKYKPEYCQELINHFDIEPYEDVKVPHYTHIGGKTKVKFQDVKRMPNKMPTIVGFARKAGVCLATIYNWLDENHGSFQPEFLETFTRIAKPLQKEFIVQNGLQGLYNPVFTKFVAVNYTDMEDKTSQQWEGRLTLAQAISKAMDEPEKSKKSKKSKRTKK